MELARLDEQGRRPRPKLPRPRWARHVPAPSLCSTIQTPARPGLLRLWPPWRRPRPDLHHSTPPQSPICTATSLPDSTPTCGGAQPHYWRRRSAWRTRLLLNFLARVFCVITWTCLRFKFLLEGLLCKKPDLTHSWTHTSH
jgi:hypothetical protein